MTKHNKEILNDYYALNEIKNKIEEYSLIKDEQINYINLWDKYLIYAVTFGIPIPIIDKLKNAYKENEEINFLMKSEALYNISKYYLQRLWDIDLTKRKKRKKEINLLILESFLGIKKDNLL